jgi:membrane protein
MRTFIRRLVGEILDDNVLDTGAMLAYYAVLALFPMMFVVVTITLLVLPVSYLDQGVAMATEAVPLAARDVLTSQVHNLVEKANAGFAIVGSAIALWGASRGAIAMMTALNTMLGIKETRSWIRRQLIAIALTVGVAGLLVVALALLVAGPWLGHLIADRINGGDTFDTIWSIGRWLVAGLLVLTVWGVLFKFLPNWHRTFRLFSPGAVAGVLGWALISWGFGLYLSHFSSYETTYGALGTAVIFLTWLWLSAVTLLVGAEINDVIEHLHEAAPQPKVLERSVHARAA